ncbi:cysteine desulfurase [Candidatus Woesearchaeota archaeon]|jgi:cysteine desulfurase|nr:cysteine desulfurase [Candidatus Woesearchaeota archaeon]MBT5396889.1 cysteine desulfurase [Candidatus Woesearchaeota archaeon]MBT5924963.1 cysteine desulfurase [Candidatus Woesearchaeota archaeon]MBT6367082.1 cysteine desulfurase [Candidatus Woesearchaeota archaeon]MBT7762344.1 cysteine desulfurase [Candidatus Woesearchaeota archaeon]
MKSNKKTIYLDNAATTYTDERVVNAMLPYFGTMYGNPHSLHSYGLDAQKVVDISRESVAHILSCTPQEIIFTSGGTESVNLAIKGVAFSKGSGHIITSKIEHPAVLRTCEFLEKNGFTVTYLNVDKDGIVNPQDVQKAITKNTILISIMYANNEIGTIEPIQDIGNIARKHNILFHTDACQATGSLSLDVSHLNVDLMTLNGSKVYGPKGVGILYTRNGVTLQPLIHGGGQEFTMRSGTENVPAIVGFAKAMEYAHREKKKENKRLIQLRDTFITNVIKTIPKSFLNGHPTERLPNNVNISFLDVEGESVLLYLNEKGIAVSTGSACSSKELEISHVLDAIGLKHDAAHGSIRFTIGRKTTTQDLKYVLTVLTPIIETLRRISPVKVKKSEIRK